MGYETIPTYDANEPCPKCGGDKVKDHLERGDITGPDFIERRCERCGYRWDREPMHAA